MRNHDRFEVIARDMVQGAPGVCCLLLDLDLRIRAASRDYERVTLREHGELSGRYLFDAFPDNPNDPRADGTAKLASSLEIAMQSRRTHTMRMQRYDIPDPTAPDEFLPKVWSPINSPLLDHGELVGVVHSVKEVSRSQQLLNEVARDVDHGVAWDPADLLHTLEAVSAVETGLHLRRQQALATENSQLMRAIATRDMIGQAKGMLGAIQHRRRSSLRSVDQTLAGDQHPGRRDRSQPGSNGAPTACGLRRLPPARELAAAQWECPR